MNKIVSAGVLLLLATGLTGCGQQKKFAVSGTVTRAGEKLTWPDGGILLVIFLPEDRQKDTNTYSADTDIATSTYKIPAIPPGKYTVAVQQFDKKFMDALGGIYDPGHTKLTREVTADGQVIDIDLPKELPKKN